MKKIDIEEMKRRMPYEVPKDFFSEMQENVLREISSKSKAKFRIQRIYWAAAASVAIIIGAGFLLLRNNNSQSAASRAAQVSVAVVQKAAEPTNNEQNTLNTEVAQDNDVNKVATVSLHRVTREDVPTRKTTSKPVKSTVDPVEKMYNDAVNNLTSQELAEQSRRYEMDTYLDLY